jgi:DNA repair exonuclease SbcCD nuclease subunit
MLFVLPDGSRLDVIGDPHLGKKFEVGVPIHRRGERETKQMQKFRDALEADADVICIVGDLFDHPYVSLGVIDMAAKAILSAAERNSDVTYVVMAGNHDLPRNVAAVGAFHDLEDRLRDRLPNLHIVRKPTVIEQVAFFPWEWDRRADEQVKDVENEDAYAAVGHWDLALFEGRDDHLAPTRELHGAFGSSIPIISGHYHVAGKYRIKGIEVDCTGSLEPYGHDQDPDQTLYVTQTLSEVLSQDPSVFRDKHLRVRLNPGEELPEIDCLALTHIRVVSPSSDSSVRQTTTSIRDFDWNKILKERIEPLDPTVKGFIKERLPYDESAQ